MGYYIHDCQKMRYKGEYKPSELRCPTTGKWVSLDDRKTLEKLDAHSFKIVSDVDEEKVSMKEEKDEFEDDLEDDDFNIDDYDNLDFEENWN